MECRDILPLKNPEIKMVDLATLKNKIISTDLVIKKFQEREAECNQLKALKKRLESDCTTYERELKQVLGELLPTKKALEEFQKTNSDQHLRIKELEDELKATSVISEQFRELAKVKEAEAEEYKALAAVEKDLKKKARQLDKTKESNHKLQEDAKKSELRLKKFQNSYVKALSVVEKLSDKLKSKHSLNKREIKEISLLKKILPSSKETDEDDDDDGLALERMLQDGIDEPDAFETETAKDYLSETEDLVNETPKSSPKKVKMVISQSENVMEMTQKKDENEAGFHVLEHHSYSLSPILENQKRKASTSPKKVVDVDTNHLCGITKVKKSPVIIVDNGVCDSVVIINEEDPLLEPKCEAILNYSKIPAELSLSSPRIEKAVTLLDPNKGDSSNVIKEFAIDTSAAEEYLKNLDCEMKELTELKADTVSKNRDYDSKTPNLNHFSDSNMIVQEIHDVVEYLVTMTCSNESEEILPLSQSLSREESQIVIETVESQPLSQNSQPQSQIANEIEKDKETEKEGHRTVTSTKVIEESTSVNVKVVDDEFKTTLRRIKRLTRRISSSASFERPLTPIPPSPPPFSPIDDVEENTFSSMEESSGNMDILHRDKLDDLFGPDSDDDSDSLGSLVPPKAFQHQESQGFESEFASIEHPHNPFVERYRRTSLQNPPCSALASRRLSNSNMTIVRNSSRQCPSSTITTNSNDNSLSNITPDNGLNVTRNDYLNNGRATNDTNANANSNFTEPTKNAPFNSCVQTFHQPKEFNSKLKANFSHNASTGSYSISIRLPDSNNPVKNMHFEIDTITNEFSLNFGPSVLQPLEDNNCATISTENSIYKPNLSSLKDSSYESSYNSGLNAEENESLISSKSNNNFNKNNSAKRSSSQISPPSLSETSSKKIKDSNDKRNSSPRPSLLKNSTPATTVIKPPSKKFTPCSSTFINPRKSLGTPDKSQQSTLNLDKPPTNPSLSKRPFLKNDSKSRNISSDSLMNSSKETMDVSVILEPSLPDKLTDQGGKPSTINTDNSKSHSKGQRSPQDEPIIPDREIPILQPMLPKRISHCAKNEGIGKEMPILTKKTKVVDQVETPTQKECGTQKRKLSPEATANDGSDDVEQVTKKMCLTRYDNKELTRIRKFCKSTMKLFNKNEEIEAILIEMYKFDISNERVKKSIAQNLYKELSNPKVVPNPKTLIDAILLFLSKVKKNPYIPTKRDFKFISPFETGVTVFLYHLANKIERFNTIVKDFKDQALFFLFSNRKLTLNGSAAVCRLLTLICMRDGDAQMARMICFNLLKEQPKTALYLVANVISTWPQIFPPNANKPSLLRDTFFKVLLHTETEINSTLKKYAMKPIRKFGEVKDNCKLNIDEIVKECVKNFQDNNASGWLLAETSHSLEIIASYKSWNWRLKHLIYMELLPLLEKNNLPNLNSVALIRFLGIVLKNYSPKLKKNVSTVMKVFLQLLTDEKSTEEIMETALFNILHLKDLLENTQLEIVKFWMNKHGDTLKPKFLINKFSVIGTI